MRFYADACIDRYKELAGYVKIKNVPTPCLEEDPKEGPAGKPSATGPVLECTWCEHTFHPIVPNNAEELEKHKAKLAKRG